MTRRPGGSEEPPRRHPSPAAPLAGRSAPGARGALCGTHERGLDGEERATESPAVKHSPSNRAAAARVLALFAPRVLSTAAEVDTLPVGSVVLRDDGEIWRRTHLDDDWVSPSSGRTTAAGLVGYGPDGNGRTVTVLFTPNTLATRATGPIGGQR